MIRTRHTRVAAGGILAGVAIAATLTGTASATTGTITGSTGTSCSPGLGATGSALIPCGTGSSDLDTLLAFNQAMSPTGESSAPQNGSALVIGPVAQMINNMIVVAINGRGCLPVESPMGCLPVNYS